MIPIADTVQRRHVPWMTWLLVAVNVAVFVFMARMSERQLHRLIARGALVPDAPRAAAWVAHMFLHGGLAHLVGNLWTLVLFGDNVEDRMGPFRFLVFYLLCGLAAALMHVWSAPDSGVLVVGASGAISGVMGAYLFMFPRARIVLLFPPFLWWNFELPAFLYLGGWFYMQIAQGAALSGSAQDGGVAFWAHVGGFMAGAVLFWFFVRRERWSRADPGYRETRRWRSG